MVKTALQTKKPYIFGHRGGMGLCIENTLDCFQKAINLGVGIESDIQLTKDGILICFHDPIIKSNLKTYDVAKLNFLELSRLKFPDRRKIPTLKALFSIIGNDSKLRLSFDIRNAKAGKKLIDIAMERDLLDRIEITDNRISILSMLRKYQSSVKLVYTIPYGIIEISQNNVNFDKLKKIEVSAINIRSHRANPRNLRKIIEREFDCYVWGLNSKFHMKRVLKLEEKGQLVAAIYTDYPNILLEIQEMVN